MGSVFDDLSRLEQLKRSDETPLKSRVAEVLYRDKYETIVADMRADWSHLNVPRRNLKETKENGKDMFYNFISNNSICGDET